MTLQRMRAQMTTLTSFAHNLANKKKLNLLTWPVLALGFINKNKKNLPLFSLLTSDAWVLRCLFFFWQFKQMDKDQTGTIDWWEFLNHEALKRIGANRSKVRIFFFLIF